MKRNLFKTAYSLLFGAVAFFLTGNAALADVIPEPVAEPVADVVSVGPVGPGGGLILILGMVSLTLTVVAVVIIVNIRKKNAK